MKPWRQKSGSVHALAAMWLVAQCLAIPGRAAAAEAVELAEYQLKAGYLYNFIVYTEWPMAAQPELLVCVYGRDPFGAALDALTKKTVGDKVVLVERLVSVDMVPPCQVVFVSREAIGNLPRLQEVIGQSPILLVADSPGASAAGIMINMMTDNGKIGFEVNLKEAQEHSLNLSFQLLRLAREVRN